jgi:hypothetical protein
MITYSVIYLCWGASTHVSIVNSNRSLLKVVEILESACTRLVLVLVSTDDRSFHSRLDAPF